MSKFFSVGVAIPNFNNGTFLEHCVESVLNQSYKNIEVLVIDDCSTDKSLEVLVMLQAKYKNFNFLVNEKNLGVSYTRHRAAQELKAEYITFIDSDDFYYSEAKIENEMQVINQYRLKGKDVAAYSNIIGTDVAGDFQTRYIDESNSCNGNCFERFVTRSDRIPTCAVYLKKYYFESGGFDPEVALYEDWDLEIRLSKMIEFYYTGEDGFAYRHHNNGLSSSKKNEHHQWLKFVFNKNIEGHKNKNKLLSQFNKNVFPSMLSRVVRKVKSICD